MRNCCGSADADVNPPSRPPTEGPLPPPKPSDGGGAKQEKGGGDGPDQCPGLGRVLEAPRLREFTLAELRVATRGLKPEMVLGEGGFGPVYKGWVDERTLNPAKSNAGVIVAVKKLNPESFRGLQEWQSEVNFLGRLSHPNLVRLLGYCGDWRGQGTAPGGVRVHVQWQPRKPPVQKGWKLGGAVVEPEAQDRHGRGARPRLPALVGETGHPQGLQGVQHPPRLGFHREAVGLRARQERALRGDVARHDPGHGRLRLRGAGVRRHRATVRQERRVRLRRGAAGAADGAARARPEPADPPAQPGGVGAALSLRRRRQAQEPHGRADGRPVPHQGRALGVARLAGKCLNSDRKSRPSMDDVVAALEDIEALQQGGGGAAGPAAAARGAPVVAAP
uniref:Tyrosine-protein kinase catalytic domain-containing protein n=3 Tax=Zea mays TaxID=4577 RepID=A0A804LD03_MAIZE